MSKTDDTANSKPAFLDFLRPKRESVTEDEIKDMVAENIELLEDEKRMINDILDLADMTVREIMKPRVDMIMAEDTEPARAALDRMRGWMRWPRPLPNRAIPACRSITRKWTRS